jgi:cell division protein FtsL
MKAGFVVMWLLAVSATVGAFIVYIALCSETVRLGYEVSAARKSQDRLLAQRRLLSLEAATLRQADRVETVARGAFGMDVPAPSRVIAIGGSTLRNAGGRND